MTLTFDLEGRRDCRSYASWYCVGVPSANFAVRYYGPHGTDIPCDLVILTFDLGGHGACGWCGSSSSICILSLKFVSLAIQKIWCSMCVSINGNPYLWPFYPETGMQFASETGNLPSKYGHAGPLGFRIIRYVRDGRKDRQTHRRTDKSNAAAQQLWPNDCVFVNS